MVHRDRRPVLVIEDSPEDYAVLERIITETRFDATLIRASDAEEATAVLERGSEGQRPCLVLLDLNLPRTDGHEILEQIRNNPLFATVPIIVLTSSDSPRDVMQAYRAGACGYVKKPNTLPEYRAAITNLCGFWLETAILPHYDTGMAT